MQQPRHHLLVCAPPRTTLGLFAALRYRVPVRPPPLRRPLPLHAPAAAKPSARRALRPPSPLVQIRPDVGRLVIKVTVCAVNGASIIVPPLPVVAPVFVLSQQDLRSIEVLKAHVKRILAPCVTHYQNLLATREEQLFRMKAAQICDPLFAKANPVTVEQINNLNVFRFAAHPILATNIEGMKNELSRYKAAVDAIPPVEQRLVSKIVTKKGKKTTVQVDTFNIAKWWQEQSGTLASFALVVRAICCQSSSSCSAERVFSILNDTFTEDQRNSRADYMELSLQLQYNNRGRV